jgi:hypothetical protein
VIFLTRGSDSHARAGALILALILAWSLPAPANAQVAVTGQSFQVLVDSSRPVTVGDTVTVRFRVRLDERDLLFDSVPQPLGTLPAGTRILSVDKLTRTPDRIFHGTARLAFYRPGRQPVPTFMLPFMRAVKGVQHATLASDSAWVPVQALLPAGNPPLKDIRELQLYPGPRIGPLLAGLVIALLVLGLSIVRRRWRASAPEPEPIVSAPRIESPYTEALARLNRVEQERWPERGHIARHYEEVVDTLREYLEASAGVPARESTSAELLWALPPFLSEEGLRDKLGELLDEADLVKFARLVPDSAAAAVFLDLGRQLLRAWHSRAAIGQMADAVR